MYRRAYMYVCMCTNARLNLRLKTIYQHVKYSYRAA